MIAMGIDFTVFGNAWPDPDPVRALFGFDPCACKTFAHHADAVGFLVTGMANIGDGGMTFSEGRYRGKGHESIRAVTHVDADAPESKRLGSANRQTLRFLSDFTTHFLQQKKKPGIALAGFPEFDRLNGNFPSCHCGGCEKKVPPWKDPVQ